MVNRGDILNRVVIGSNNTHKIREIQEILSEFNFTCISLDDFGLRDFEIEENADTFEGNSLIKAEAVLKECNLPTIADDSGLMVDSLNGEPGVFSARYAGESCDDMKNNLKLLEALKGESNRSAKFVSVITMLFPSGRKIVARGECYGKILESLKGSTGFGYDPLFLPDGYDETFAQMSSDEKNRISHRSKALDILKEKLKEYET